MTMRLQQESYLRGTTPNNVIHERSAVSRTYKPHLSTPLMLSEEYAKADIAWHQ